MLLLRVLLLRVLNRYIYKFSRYIYKDIAEDVETKFDISN